MILGNIGIYWEKNMETMACNCSADAHRPEWDRVGEYQA